MKKFLLILLALLLLAGCDPGGNKPDPTPAPDPDPVVTDPGLSQEELMAALSLEDAFFGPDERFVILFSGTDNVFWYLQNSGYMRGSKITAFEYLKNNKYKITVTVPASEGTWEEDPYDEYTVDFEFVYEPDNKRFLEIKSTELNGSFVANPVELMHEVEVQDASWQIFPDHHTVGRLYGTSVEGFGHSYYMELERDDKTIDAAIFAKGKEQRIYETTPASRLEIGRYYYCTVIREQILAHVGGNWILVYDYKNKKTYTFEDVFCYFEVENGRYIMNIATEYNEVEDEGSAYIVPVFDQYEFTEKGLVKLNS